MPVFISYSHADEEFAKKLALDLVMNKVHVFFDQWELHAGDSLLSKIQDAITGASALLVILSKASVKSEWCKKELNAGLMRELDEKRVVVIPVLLEDCTVPTFLREKMYADFRKNYEKGRKTILEAVAKVTSQWQGRLQSLDYHTDWSIDWDFINGMPLFRITMVDHHKDSPYTIVGEIQILVDPVAALWYLRHTRDGTADIARRDIIGALAMEVRKHSEFNVLLESNIPEERRVAFRLGDADLIARASVRWLGTNTGRPVLMRIGGQIDNIDRSIKANSRTNVIPPPIDESEEPSAKPNRNPAKKKAAARPTKKAKKSPAKAANKTKKKSRRS